MRCQYSPCVLLMLAARGASAQFPFGEPVNPPPGGPPPGMGELLSEVQVLEEPQQLKELISSSVVSLILFTEGEEETLEAQWFMFFSTLVEKSIDVRAGDARVNWGMADNAKLRKSSACVSRSTAGPASVPLPACKFSSFGTSFHLDCLLPLTCLERHVALRVCTGRTRCGRPAYGCSATRTTPVACGCR